MATWLSAALDEHQIGRRDFLAFCGAMAAYLGLPATPASAQQVADALAAAKKPVLVWLEFQDCAGNSESLLRSGDPSTADVILDVLSVDYHETIMAAAGHLAEEALQETIKANKGSYLAVVEGSIPTGAGGAYCTIGGRSALQIAEEVCRGAAATIAVGTCAAFGGLPAAAPNPTGALGVSEAIPGLPALINLPACPVNVENLVALVVYYLTLGHWPPLDANLRPTFAYGKSIHDNCERRAHFDAGQYVEQFGDAGHRKGYCLYKVGCKGPVTYQNCPVVRWNGGTNWPIGCGHPCMGCAEPNFWDTMTPFYKHLKGVPGFGIHSDIDTVGAWATAGVAAGVAGHGTLQFIKRRRLVMAGAVDATHPEAASPADDPPTPEPPPEADDAAPSSDPYGGEA